MTVNTSNNRIEYSGNGTTTVFAYNFRILDQTHVEVILVDSAGVETTQTLTTHYTVTGVGAAGGGDITMVTAPASGESLVIRRNMPFTQNTDYTSGDAFPAETHESALDELTMNDQQLDEAIQRSLRAPNQDPTMGALPNIASRNDKLITFDLNGDPLATGYTNAQLATLVANGTTTDPVTVMQVEVQYGRDAVANVFTLQTTNYTPGANNLLVFENGQYLAKTINYTETSSSKVALTFTPGDDDEYTFLTNVVTTNSAVSTAAITHTDSGTDYNLATYLQARHIPSVVDFGAVGDGVTFDTAAFSLGASNGKLVFVPYSALGYVVNSGVTNASSTFIFEGDSSQLLGTATPQQLNAIFIDQGQMQIGGVPYTDELKNSKIEIVAGTIRQDSTTRTNWNYIKDANHEPIGVDDSTPATASGAIITVPFNKTYSRVISLVAGADETLSNALNLNVGASVGLGLFELKASISATLAANVYYDGAAWQTDYGPGQGGTGNHNIEITSVAWNAGTATVDIDHDFCPGYDIVATPYQRSGSATSPVYIPVVYSTTKTVGASYKTRVRFIDPGTGANATTEATNMSFILRKSYNEGIVLDGTDGTDKLDLDKGNIWFIGIFEL